ncbi:MAG: hypothetical protein II292_01165, partial [Clostridia bacterium]|nr:hypothetical protein [Clostridia bacterium]
MKRGMLSCFRIFVLIITALVLTTALSINVFAKTPEERKSENTALMNERMNSIVAIFADNNAENEAGRKTNNHILTYMAALNGFSDLELEQTSTAYLIEIYYTQAIAINNVAKIYYTHIASFEGEAKDRVDFAFEEIDGAISSATDYNVLNESINALYGNGGLCAKMLVCIYSEKLDALLIEGDSAAVNALVDSAKKEIERCTDNSLAAPEYEEILARTAKAVAIQRNQDKA